MPEPHEEFVALQCTTTEALQLVTYEWARMAGGDSSVEERTAELRDRPTDELMLTGALCRRVLDDLPLLLDAVTTTLLLRGVKYSRTIHVPGSGR